MSIVRQRLTSIFLITAVSLSGSAGKKSNGSREESTGEGPPVMWRMPENIRSRDLRHGIGGQAHAPKSLTYDFVKEQTSGSNPKFVVNDSEGTEWKVKLGAEARPEVAASRLVWSVGYFTDEDYFVREIRVKDMPRLKRGERLVTREANGYSVLRNARLERDPPDISKIRSWSWKDDTFYRTREWNGLRVLMALINNWDMKDVNNAVYQYRAGKPDAYQLYVVSDLGVSFGSATPSWPIEKSRGNLPQFAKSRFINKVESSHVDFQTPGQPTMKFLVNLPQYFRRLALRDLGRRVPIADARWMAGLLGQLSPRQIRDAFRAAEYQKDDVEEFAAIIERRISELREI